MTPYDAHLTDEDEKTLDFLNQKIEFTHFYLAKNEVDDKGALHIIYLTWLPIV